MRFEVKFGQTDQKIPVFFQDNKAFGTTFQAVQKVTERLGVEYYTGNYDVTPMVNPQRLATKDKFLKDDVKVQSIPYYDVGNTSGGSTVYIGMLE